MKPRCFGTREYSKKSLICKRCDYYKLCGKIKDKINNKRVGRRRRKNELANIQEYDTLTTEGI